MTTDPSAPLEPPILDADDALAELVAGNKRFVSGRPEHGHRVSAAAAASGGQQPHAVVLGCIDSRVPLEAIFDQTFGSICVVRSGAHVLDRAVLGSVDFAVDKLGVPLIMVLGHKRCGAVQASVDAVRAGERPGGDIGYLVGEIAPAVRGGRAGHPGRGRAGDAGPRRPARSAGCGPAPGSRRRSPRAGSRSSAPPTTSTPAGSTCSYVRRGVTTGMGVYARIIR